MVIPFLFLFCFSPINSMEQKEHERNNNGQASLIEYYSAPHAELPPYFQQLPVELQQNILTKTFPGTLWIEKKYFTLIAVPYIQYVAIEIKNISFTLGMEAHIS